MLDELINAREAAGKSADDVAEYLGVTVDQVEEVESGQYELNLTELRQWALAVEAIVEIRVFNRALEKTPEIYQAIVHERNAVWDRSLEPSPENTESWIQFSVSNLVPNQVSKWVSP
ncbi:hypothetical protein C6401_11070 [Arthrobacter woluwensis]|nr:hypothetical protein C6401_11070 [Arthrobacter woluwensis]